MENKKHYWSDEVRLKMIEKSEFYSDPKLYQFGFYDGYHSLTRELSGLREERDRLRLTLSGKTFFDEREVMQKEIDELREENERLKEVLKVELWAMENGEAESQRQGKPRLTERLEMIRELLQSKKP